MAGKFDSPMAEALWEISMNGGQDEEMGDTDHIGWFARFNFDTPGSVRRWTHTGRTCQRFREMGIDDARVLIYNGPELAILQEDSQGFVYAWFATSKDWDAIAAEIYPEDESDDDA